MAARKCPMCMAKVPAGHTVAYTDGMTCGGCGAKLEISMASRYLATLAGIAAALIAWRLSYPSAKMLGWVLPAVYAIVAYGVVSPIAQMLIADLVVKEEEPETEPAHAGRRGGHH